MEQTFTQHLAQEIKAHYGEQTANICVVFPNRRPALLLKKELSAMYPQPVWLPDMFSIEDFFQKFHDFAVLDPIMLAFELYQVYRQLLGDQAQAFHEFIDWAPTLLNDFNEIDSYLVEPGAIFDNLADFKYFSIWDPAKESVSELENNYLRFFRSLKKIYEAFRAHLFEKSYAYQGLANRLLIENFDDYFRGNPYSTIIFAGFNALTKSEAVLIERLKEKGIAKTYWDSDRYYMEQGIQEAGYFLRQYKKKGKKEFKWIFDNFSRKDRNDRIIGTSGNVNQIKVAAEILKEIATRDPGQIEKTALILNREDLIVPVLNAIPPEIEYFNVTMGLPISSTHYFQFIRQIFEMQNNVNRYSRPQGFIFYHRDLTGILQSIPVKHYIDRQGKSKEIKDFIRKITLENKLFFPVEKLQQALPQDLPLLPVIFSPWEDKVSKAITQLTEIFSNMQSYENNGKDAVFSTEYITKFLSIFNRISLLINEYDIEMDINTLKKYLIQISKHTRIPFSGEPIKGLQIMGLLESRVLDFDNIIMLSTNENIIPKGNQENSFFLHELRKYFGLPVPRNHTAIYAYHFYRSIQRAKNTYLIYNTEVDDFGSSEMSRFLLQLKHELPAFNGKPVEDFIVNPPTVFDDSSQTISITKNDAHREKLAAIAKRGFSATAITTYLHCPLQFYFQYIASLQEEENIEETIEARTSGKVIHSVLENLYKPYINRILTVQDFKTMLQKYKEMSREYYRIHYLEGDIDTGKNRLIFETTLLLIKKLLLAEKNILAGNELIIKSTEENFEVEFPHNINSVSIRLRGQIDRIDSFNGELRIVDYKSGNVEAKDLSIGEIYELKEGKHNKAFQTLFYAYAYNLQTPLSTPVTMGIISFRNIPGEVLIPLQIRINDGKGKQKSFDFQRELSGDFEQLLVEIFTEMLDEKTPYTQSPHKEHCTYCNFTNICNR